MLGSEKARVMREELELLLDTLAHCEKAKEECKMYLFGSILDEKCFPKDIDILIIYDSAENLKTNHTHPTSHKNEDGSL